MQFQYKQVKMFPMSRGVETPPPTVRWFKPPAKLKSEPLNDAFRTWYKNTRSSERICVVCIRSLDIGKNGAII